MLFALGCNDIEHIAITGQWLFDTARKKTANYSNNDINRSDQLVYI